ncbi:C-8,7 sterol isomerase isoform 1 [Hibiscus syriacus]|uniref:C-8,7 sterol isomerase isoform 1 n=2 Tax=Hibiscus syriacus TaxID=106335 RepID=A0A6A3BV64_HIBSY|nr:C-8,7 sterol isomerase isoform 1 [Hibiscus syriacus]
MDWTSLELKLISCKGLKAFNFFQKLSAYSVVSMVVINEQSKKKEEHQKKHLQRQKTSIERGGKNPEWNHLFEFDLRGLSPEETDHVFLKFDLRADVLVDRTIGEVRVPLKGLIDEYDGVVRYLTYQVRNSDGKPNGVLNFSYKLKGKIETSENHDYSSPEKPHCSPEKVVYPKVELDDVIRYPSLDIAATYTVPTALQGQTPVEGSDYSRNLGLPVQGVAPGGYFDPYSRPSPVMLQPSATYWYAVQSSLQR